LYLTVSDDHALTFGPDMAKNCEPC
jgi:hypothetical protein